MLASAEEHVQTEKCGRWEHCCALFGCLNVMHW